ncbi:MAG TPA: hypothetical protein VL356_07960 [Acidocella sp.]|nr:hypothetical protein [Acidocella sp.]
MTRFMKILAAAALAVVPLAANATTVTPLDHVQTHVHKAISGPRPEVQRVANVAATGQTIVQSGTPNQAYPDTLGG